MEFRILARYSFPYEAHIAKDLLALEGIPAFISDEHIVSVNWLYSDMVGGVKLWVRQGEMIQAQKILKSDYSNMLDTEFDPGSDVEGTAVLQSQDMHWAKRSKIIFYVLLLMVIL